MLKIKDKLRLIAGLALPIVLIALMFGFFVKKGPLGVFKADMPPIEKLFIERVVFEPEQITLKVFNDGPEPVTVAQVLVHEIIWQFDMTPDNTLEPLEMGEVFLNYPWTEGDPIAFTLIASDGVTFEKEVDVAFMTPKFNMLYVKTFVLLGLYVGVIPVLFGLLFFPFLRRLRGAAYMFLLSLTVGLLIFLGFDTLEESFELIGELPDALNGMGILVIGFLLAVLALSAVSYKTEFHAQKRGDEFKSLVWAYLIAFGIGLHNMGEGLAIGSAYAVGEFALGSALVIGFMIHNLTEGVAIVSPLTQTSKIGGRFIGHVILMGLLAGGPTIVGSLIGGFAYSPFIALFFLAIGAGAIFDVSFDILHYMAKGRWKSLFTGGNVSGFLLGLLAMYVTGFLVLG